MLVIERNGFQAMIRSPGGRKSGTEAIEYMGCLRDGGHTVKERRGGRDTARMWRRQPEEPLQRATKEMSDIL